MPRGVFDSRAAYCHIQANRQTNKILSVPLYIIIHGLIFAKDMAIAMSFTSWVCVVPCIILTPTYGKFPLTELLLFSAKFLKQFVSESYSIFILLFRNYFLISAPIIKLGWKWIQARINNLNLSKSFTKLLYDNNYF